MQSIVRCRLGLSAGVLAVAAGGGHAQQAVGLESASGRTLTIVPSLSITETLTDNSRIGSGSRQSDSITQIRPSLRVVSNGGRVKGFLDYSLNGLVYARNSSNNDIQNSLRALANIEAIDNWAFVDTSANISQQAISAFGTRSIDPSLVNNNRTEVRNFSLSPSIRGRVAELANYEARLTQTWTRSSPSTAADHNNDVSQAMVRLGGDTALRSLSWSTDATRQVIDYRAGRRTEDDRLRGVLYVAVDPELRVSLIGGRESNNYLSPDKEGRGTSGWGVDWGPTERTRISAQREQRFFGKSHAFLFLHRMARSVWKYSDTRDVTTGFGQANPTSLGSAYDLLFAQFASRQPDPTLRAKLVDEFLQTNGIPPATQVFTGSLASAVTLQRRQELSFALLGIRDTVTFLASQSEGRRLDTVTAVIDDFANGNLVRQRGFSLHLAHRFTPISTLNLIASADRITGRVAASQTTTLRSISLNWTGQSGPRSHVSLGARRSKFDSPSEPYTESALTASLNLQF